MVVSMLQRLICKTYGKQTLFFHRIIALYIDDFSESEDMLSVKEKFKHFCIATRVSPIGRILRVLKTFKKDVGSEQRLLLKKVKLCWEEGKDDREYLKRF